ncbi:hypothetical protein H4R20_007385 [Coemansia guatemalensis]|uniref:DUF6570 domain-containing protein n=1 Tax=Coemansia guatemalensis TaxID=2761395 RepID=A0A9W8HMK5_9FUNG|nr:hypothetical protein H4R20_007385 [Coemansia guatemalensis]
MARCNGYYFPAYDRVTAELNEVEQRLVAPRHSFQAIWPVGGVSGQLRALGPVINVPVDPAVTLRRVVSMQIPRPLDPNMLGVFPVRLYRRMTYASPYLVAMVNEDRVRHAARFLEQQTLYRHYRITFNRNWTVVGNSAVENGSTELAAATTTSATA